MASILISFRGEVFDDPVMITNTLAGRIAAVFGFLAVALGAFGAHALKRILEENGTAAIWQTAVFYHFVHAVMMFLTASREPFARLAWIGFCAGVLIFSGSLYVLALTNVKWLGAITPIGGVSFLIGWLMLAIQSGNRNAEKAPK